jgi:hypothetical protein
MKTKDRIDNQGRNTSSEKQRGKVESLHKVLNMPCSSSYMIAGATLIAISAFAPIFLIPPLFYAAFIPFIPDPHLIAKAQSSLWDAVKFLTDALIMATIAGAIMLTCELAKHL